MSFDNDKDKSRNIGIKDKSRNIGIIAHIDAGKTTTSERILFYGGRIKKIGEVHEGKATMDSMKQEQDRGITIASAATSIQWEYNGSHYDITLIDTPGHVDFQMEVIRSLSVLDGAVLVLDSANGPEAQTLSVTKQAIAKGVPLIIYVNKMDKINADFIKCIEQCRTRANIIPIAVQFPLHKGGAFDGFIDLIERKYNKWTGKIGEAYQTLELTDEQQSIWKNEYERLLINPLLENCSEDLAIKIVDEKATKEEIRHEIRRQVNTCIAAAVCCGSSYKNTGVEKLLDAVIDYLPSPEEKTQKSIDNEIVLCDSNAPLVAFVFKIQEDKFAGSLTYMRIFAGSIKKGQDYLLQRTKEIIRFAAFYKMHSTERERVEQAVAGDIIVVTGYTDLITGDTITDKKSKICMESIVIPERVISMSIKPKNKDQSFNDLIKLLEVMRREDPSFDFYYDSNAGEIIVSGMGELHIEVKIACLAEKNFPVVAGKPQVKYRETVNLSKPYELVYEHKKQTGGKGQYAKIILRVEPLNNINSPCEFHWEIFGTDVTRNMEKPIEQGIKEGCKRGILLGSELTGLKFTLIGGAMHSVDSDALSFSLAGQYAIVDFMKHAKAQGWSQGLEPIVNVFITNVDESNCGLITGLINSRSGVLTSVEHGVGPCATTIVAVMPTASTIGIITEFRKVSQGQATFTQENAGYQKIPASKLEAVLAAM